MINKIDSFTGEYEFLSNFYVAPVTFDDLTYTNNEAAFQAQKCINPKDRIRFTTLNPTEAKKLGREIRLRLLMIIFDTVMISPRCCSRTDKKGKH